MPHRGVAAPPLRSQSRRAGQSVDDFYRRAEGAPLWLSPTAGDAARAAALAPRRRASLEGSTPHKYHVAAAAAGARRRRARGKRKDIERADRALSQAFVAYVARPGRDPGRRHHLRRSAAEADTADAARGPARGRGRAVAVRLCARHRLDAPVLRRSFARRSPSTRIATTTNGEVLELNLKRARALPAGKQRYVLVNAAQQRLYMYEDGKPVDSMVVVVGKPKCPTPMLDRLHPLCGAQSLLVRAARPRRGGCRAVRGQAGFRLSRRGWGTRRCPTGRRNPTIIDPKTIDWEAVRRRQGRRADPPEARGRTISWAG